MWRFFLACLVYLTTLSYPVQAKRKYRRLTLDLRRRIQKIDILFPEELSFRPLDVDKQADVFAAEPFVIEETVLFHKRYSPTEYDWVVIVHILQWSEVAQFSEPSQAAMKKAKLTLISKTQKRVGDPGTVYKYIQRFQAGRFIKLYAVFGNENQTDILAAAFPLAYEKRFVARLVERVLHSAYRSSVAYDKP
ncbi:MAG: hypothetical protein OXT67_06525 [Zetaproteobacteria bacterium]|nr:hypothetical protein [Zetaproteobacteria bacterium]